MDNAAFDRLARLLGGGASRRHALRALAVAALTGAAAESLLAADKNNGRDKRNKRGGNSRGRNGRDRTKSTEDSGSPAIAAEGKKRNKRKRKNKKKGGGNGSENGVGYSACADTPLRPGQDFLGCDFAGDDLRGEDLNSSSFKDVDLSEADLCGADLESTSFAESDLSGANLTAANLDSSSHSSTSFAGANLENASFNVATFSEVDFSGANLARVNFRGAAFDEVDVSGAVFCQTVRPDGSVDNRDCDACDNACGACQGCRDEDCQPSACCPAPDGPGGTCADLATDPLNCGACGRACSSDLADACVDGQCVCGNDEECRAGETCCAGTNGNAAACLDTASDVDNCGACGDPCPTSLDPCFTAACVNGACEDVPVANGTPCGEGEDAGICCAGAETVVCVADAACCTSAECNEGDACCEGRCVFLGLPFLCCTVADCPQRPCHTLVGCGTSNNRHRCQYVEEPDETSCTLGDRSGTCFRGDCRLPRPPRSG